MLLRLNHQLPTFIELFYQVEKMSEIEELTQFLGLDTRLDVKAVAMHQILSNKAETSIQRVSLFHVTLFS